MSVALSGRRRPKQTTSVRGRKSTRWTQNGGSYLSSVHKAAPRTRRPPIKLTKTAGPSPESAKLKSRPQLLHCGASARKPEKRLPRPQRGQVPFSPHTKGDCGGYCASSRIHLPQIMTLLSGIARDFHLLFYQCLASKGRVFWATLVRVELLQKGRP